MILSALKTNTADVRGLFPTCRYKIFLLQGSFYVGFIKTHECNRTKKRVFNNGYF